jgi:hypothetical protein
MMVSFAAGLAAAEDGSPWWKLGLGKKKEAVEQPAPFQRQQGMRPEGRGGQGEMQRNRPQLNEQQRAQMKAHFEAVQKLAEGVRNETDPAKKAEMTAALRAKLSESAERMQTEFRKRVEKAEADIVKMKKRLEDGEMNKDKRIDEQLQKLLSGEQPFRKGFGDKPHRAAPPAE